MVLLPRRKSTIFLVVVLGVSILLSTGALAACGGNATTHIQATPTPTPDPAQSLLANMNKILTGARSTHSIFNLSISGQTFSGKLDIESWSVPPAKSRIVVQQSTISQMATGAVIVTDGKTLWQYDPTKNVVYTGPITPVNNANNTSGGSIAALSGGTGQSFLALVQSIFQQSKGKLRLQSATQVAGHNVYDVAIQPQTSDNNSGDSNGVAGAPATGVGFSLSNLNYTGDVFIDKQTQLPVQVLLTVAGLGKIQLDIPVLEVNTAIPSSTFTFATPAGAQVKPLQNSTPTTTGGMISLVEAGRRAGYHLLSIPPEQIDYTLNGVTVLGSTGNETFSLNYMKGNQSFTLVESKSLANLSGGAGSQSVQVRNANGSFVSHNGNSTLAWTEEGVGIQIIGPFSQDQALAIAGLLS